MNNLKYYLDEVQQLFEQEQFLAEPQELYAPVDYTLRLGGKRIRPTLLLAATALFGGNTTAAHGAALGIETFHNFTLLHDDLMDRSPLRRGQPTVYRKWNENTAILSGDTMYALSWRYFLRQPAPRQLDILRCFAETAIGVCEGQQYDMNFEHQPNVTLDQYLSMIRLKTAILLAAALKIGALYTNAPDNEIEHLYNFGIHLGLAFQLQDDLLDGYGDTAVFGKKTGQDIRDNKKTFLPLTALTLCNPEQAARLHHLFSNNNTCNEEEKVRNVMDIYNAVGLRPIVEQAIQNEFQKACQSLDALNAPEDGKAPLRELLATLAGRKK